LPTSAAAVLEITSLLKAWGRGERSALDQLIPSIYAELRRIAQRHARRGHPDQTLHTTALVNEAYLRLIDVQGVEWKDRAHFFAVSSQIMRRILVDAARARATVKRGGGHPLNETTSFNWNAVPDLSAKRDRELIALDDALEELGKLDDRKRQVVEMRFFAGMNAEEAAESLRVSEKTVLRDWKLARAWLKREMAKPRR
jgi:RNA polymerase sigma factor (TIGR02999 family)